MPTMTKTRLPIALFAAAAALTTLTACKMDVDEMVMNPTTRDEIITRLLEESVAKQNIIERLTSADDT